VSIIAPTITQQEFVRAIDTRDVATQVQIALEATRERMLGDGFNLSTTDIRNMSIDLAKGRIRLASASITTVAKETARPARPGSAAPPAFELDELTIAELQSRMAGTVEAALNRRLDPRRPGSGVAGALMMARGGILWRSWNILRSVDALLVVMAYTALLLLVPTPSPKWRER